jgi:hypothetical protein
LYLICLFYFIEEKYITLSCSFRSLLDVLCVDRGRGGLVLLKEPIHAAIDALLQSPERLVAQCPLSLVDVVVASHAAHDDGLAGESRCLAKNTGNHLADVAEGDTKLTIEVPVGLCSLVVARGVPDGAGKVPEVNRSVVCNKEGLTIDTLVVEGDCRRRGGGKKELRGEKMGVGDVADIGKIEKILVGTNLDCVLAALVGIEDACEGLDVTLAKDASWANRGCKEFGVVLAVGLDNDFLGLSL